MKPGISEGLAPSVVLALVRIRLANNSTQQKARGAWTAGATAWSLADAMAMLKRKVYSAADSRPNLLSATAASVTLQFSSSCCFRRGSVGVRAAMRGT
jgi:hypothetical protein